MTEANHIGTITELRYQAILHGAANIDIRRSGMRGALRVSIVHASYGTLAELDKVSKRDAHSYSRVLLAELVRLRAVEKGVKGMALAA